MIRDFGGFYLGKRVPDKNTVNLGCQAYTDDIELLQPNEKIQKNKIESHNVADSKKWKIEDDFLIREKNELSLDEFKQHSLMNISLYDLEQFTNYIEPLKKRKLQKHPSNGKRINRNANSSFSQMIDHAGEASNNTSTNRQQDTIIKKLAFEKDLTVANFNTLIAKRMSYLNQAYHFLNYYFRDCTKADLNQIAIKSGISKEVLQLWLDNRHCIVHLLTVLSKNQT